MKSSMMGNKSAVIVTCLLAITFATAGCSSKRGGGMYDNELSADQMAAESSIDQFEGTGEVAAGGVFQDVGFGFDSDGLDATAMEAVRNNAAIMEANPGLKAEIEGHCDERGSSEYNLALGARRARAVRDAMTGLGISHERMSTVSYGEELPLCKDTSESCWAENRRGHLVELRR